MYGTALEDMKPQSSMDVVSEAVESLKENDDATPALPAGWAVKERKKHGRISQSAKDYVKKAHVFLTT